MATLATTRMNPSHSEGNSFIVTNGHSCTWTTARAQSGRFPLVRIYRPRPPAAPAALPQSPLRSALRRPPAALFSVNRARCRPKRILLCLPLRHSRSRGLGPGRSQLPISRYVLYLAKSVAASPAGRIVPLPSAVQILAVPLLSLSCLRPEAPRDGRRQGGTPETARPGQRISRALFVVESSGKGSRISSLTSRVILRLSCMWVFLRFSSAFVFRLS